MYCITIIWVIIANSQLRIGKWISDALYFFDMTQNFIF